MASSKILSKLDLQSPLRKLILTNPDTQHWMEVRYSSHIIPERRAYHATFMHNNRVYIHGGEDIYEGSLSNMWYIDLDIMKADSQPNWQRVNYVRSD
jgi:hypothetical protein